MIVWQNRMFCECLAGRPYPRVTRKTQLSPSVLTLRILVMCRAHASFRGMLLAKTFLTSIAWVFTHSFYIAQSLQLNPTINIKYKRLNKITIKFGTKLKPTKHIVVNYNFTNNKIGTFRSTLYSKYLILKVVSLRAFKGRLRIITSISFWVKLKTNSNVIYLSDG